MKQKGFTLIELLAVIVILAIIMLIATPVVINIIDDARQGSFKNSSHGIIKSAELVHSKSLLSGDNIQGITFTYTDGVETSNPTGFKLDYKGARPQNGEVIINDSGNVALALHDGTYCAKKNYTDADVTITKVALSACKLT